MYGLPKFFDGAFLIGRQLEMVCFSENQMTLHFGEGTIITIMSSFSYRSAKLVHVPVKQSNLMSLLGAQVLTVKSSREGTLTLIFQDDRRLKIYDSLKQYESYTITHAGGTIIV